MAPEASGPYETTAMTENEDVTYPQGIDDPEGNQSSSVVDDDAKLLEDKVEIETPDDEVYHPSALTPSTLVWVDL